MKDLNVSVKKLQYVDVKNELNYAMVEWFEQNGLKIHSIQSEFTDYGYFDGLTILFVVTDNVDWSKKFRETFTRYVR